LLDALGSGLVLLGLVTPILAKRVELCCRLGRIHHLGCSVLFPFDHSGGQGL
jgi:hypothetical protein